MASQLAVQLNYHPHGLCYEYDANVEFWDSGQLQKKPPSSRNQTSKVLQEPEPFPASHAISPLSGFKKEADVRF
jgi:hypothetical protein